MGDDDALLTAVPTAILRQVRAHLACLREFNAGLARWRALEQRVGGAGRYEYEYRLHDPEAVFAALGGRPALEPWSPAAWAWQREVPPTEEHADA
jgi:hypothetical protein